MEARYRKACVGYARLREIIVSELYVAQWVYFFAFFFLIRNRLKVVSDSELYDSLNHCINICKMVCSSNFVKSCAWFVFFFFRLQVLGGL